MEADAFDQAKQRHPGRALVALVGERVVAPGARPRPLATFVAQLLACQSRMAQFRQRRRAPSSSAAALYRGGTSRPAARFERKL
jgi:hypothetical protein